MEERELERFSFFLDLISLSMGTHYRLETISFTDVLTFGFHSHCKRLYWSMIVLNFMVIMIRKMYVVLNHGLMFSPLFRCLMVNE